MQDYKNYLHAGITELGWDDEASMPNYLLNQIAIEREQIVRVLISGQTESWESYKYKCGLLKGLSDVELMIKKFKRSH